MSFTYNISFNKSFENGKKTFLSKIDKSRKRDIDEKIRLLIDNINSKPDYFTTSSCSGRVYLWTGSKKKNEVKWLKVSHDFISESFFELNQPSQHNPPEKGLENNAFSGLVWLRVEPLIMHVACRNMIAANRLLRKARLICKKSCLLSASNKIMVEIRGSEFMEMPLFLDGNMLFCGEISLLAGLVNAKLSFIFKCIKALEKKISAEKDIIKERHNQRRT